MPVPSLVPWGLPGDFVRRALTTIHSRGTLVEYNNLASRCLRRVVVFLEPSTDDRDGVCAHSCVTFAGIAGQPVLSNAVFQILPAILVSR